VRRLSKSERAAHVDLSPKTGLLTKKAVAPNNSQWEMTGNRQKKAAIHYKICIVLTIVL
jgi:hypothetical protein